MKCVKRVLVFENGNVAAIDEDGQQVVELQKVDVFTAWLSLAVSEGHDLSDCEITLPTKVLSHSNVPRSTRVADLTVSGTEMSVCEDIARRQALGVAKYGTTVAGNPLELRQWLQHAYEECLDQAVYLRRTIQEIDGGQ